MPKPNPIRNARERAGLSRAQLAVRAGVSFSTVSLAERGLVTTTTAAKIAPVLGVDVAALRSESAK